MKTKRPHPFQRNRLFSAIFLLSIIFTNACKKPKTEPAAPEPVKIFPKEFIVSVKDRETDRVTISWTSQTGESLTYDIELDGRLLVKDLLDFRFDIKGLTAARAYTGKVTARNSEGNTTTSAFDIQILDQEIYMTNIIDYNWVKAANDGSGKLYWKINNGGNLLAIPAISGDTIFMGGSPTAIAVNRHSGTLIWSRPASTPDNLALLSYKGKLVLPGENKLEIINSNTGSSVWTLNLSGYTEPFIHKGVLYTTANHTVYAYDLHTGLKKWEFLAGGKAASTLVNDGTVYFVGDEGNFYALNAIDGTLKWKNSFTGTLKVYEHHSPRPSVMGNNLYFTFAKDLYFGVGTSHTVRAVNKITGGTIWSKVMGDDIEGLRVMPSTRLGLCVATNRRMYHLDLLTGKERQHSGSYFSDSFFNAVENQVYYTSYLSKTTLAVATHRPIELGSMFVMPNGDGWWRIPVIVKEGKVYYPAECAMNSIE